MVALWPVIGKKMRPGKIKEEEKNLKMSLESAIEQLYDVFSTYPLASGLRDRSCECCVTDEEISELTRSPLKDITIEGIGHFMRSAVTTYGDENDLKHFIPRIIELFQDKEYNLADDFLTFEKLNYCNWQNWELKEIDAIQTYLKELWKDCLLKNSPISMDVFQLVNNYCGLQIALELWGKTSNKKSMAFLIEYLLYPTNMNLNEAENKIFSQWLASDEVLNNFMEIYFEEQDQQEANKISIAYTLAEQSKTINKQ